MDTGIFETERLRFRQLVESDYADVAEILQNERGMRYVRGFGYSDAEVKSWIRKQMERYRRDGFGKWALLEKKTGTFIGVCGISMQEVSGQKVPEIGYFIKEAYWNRGYATEAAERCREYAFRVLGFSEVFSLIGEGNAASRRVAEKLGMEYRQKVNGRLLALELFSVTA